MKQRLRILAVLACAVALAVPATPALAQRGASGFVKGGWSGGHHGSGGGWRGGVSRHHGGRHLDYRVRRGGRHHRGYDHRGRGYHRGYDYRGRGYHRGYDYRGRGYHRGYGHHYRPYRRYYGYWPRWHFGWSWWPYWSWYYPRYYGWGYPYNGWGYPYYGWSYPRYYGWYGSSRYEDDDEDDSWRGWSREEERDRTGEQGRRGGPSRGTYGPAGVRLRTAPGAAIYVDDRFVGAADRDGVLFLELEPGQHQVAVVHPSRDTLSRTVHLRSRSDEIDLRR